MGFFPFAPLPVAGALITPPINLTGATATTQLDTTQVTGDTNPRVALLGGGIGFGNGTVAVNTLFMQYGGAGVTQFNGKIQATNNVDINTAGFGLAVAEGSNAKQGTATLTAGTVTVANTSVTANSRIFLTGQVLGGTAGGLNVTSRVAGTSFTVTSTNAADTSTFAYEIFEPG